MENKYRKTKTTVSLIRYHFVFCPRYRRKIFNINGVEESFKELAIKHCTENDIEVIALECNVDHVHIFVSALPSMSPSDIMQVLKGSTSHTLREQFTELSSMPSLWTRSFFVSTAGEISSEQIKEYVETQKTRP